MWHQIYEISWETPWHLKVSRKEIHRFESTQVPCCQVVCNGKLLWGPQRTAMEAGGGQRINIKQHASFLDRTDGRARKGGSMEKNPKKEGKRHHFSSWEFPLGLLPNPTHHGEDSEGTPALGSCGGLSHSFHMLPTPVVLTIKNGVSVGWKEVWFGD